MIEVKRNRRRGAGNREQGTVVSRSLSTVHCSLFQCFPASPFTASPLPPAVAHIGQGSQRLKCRDTCLPSHAAHLPVTVVKQCNRNCRQQECCAIRDALSGTTIHHPTAHRIQPVRHPSRPASPLDSHRQAGVNPSAFGTHIAMFNFHFSNESAHVSRGHKHGFSWKLRKFIFGISAQPFAATPVQSGITGGAGSSRNQASRRWKAGAAEES
jgi:hypothetical protein